MQPPLRSRTFRRRLAWLSIAVVTLAVLGAWLLSPQPQQQAPHTTKTPAATATKPAAGPPWYYGPANARFTLILYADLECPYCKAYFPVVKAWVDQHPETRLQWHHLPLPMHEPVASRLASLAECAGETGGQAAYWNAVGWIYQHTRGDGQGLPEGVHYPGQTPALQACLESGKTQNTVQTQAREGARDGIAATPTLRVRDERTGQALLLHGPVEGDALLSALDFLAADDVPAPDPESPGMSAADTGDMPR